MSERGEGAALATFSMVFGLFSIPCFSLPLPALPAVVLGHIALGHIGSAETHDARGRAWIGLLLGYMSIAVFGIFAILFAIGTAFPQEDKAPETAEVVPAERAHAATEQPAPPLPAGVNGQDQPDDVFLLNGDARYHRFFCSTTGDLDTQRTRLTDTIRAGFKPCEVCQPGN